MANLEQKLKKQIESGDLELPVLPAVGAQVLILTQNDESDARDLANLIQNDQSLTSYVMKVANSAAFNSLGKIKTLQQAITKLGMKNISQMALTMTVGQSIFRSDPLTREVIEYLWRHSLACALWSREIARQCRINSEVTFIGGLLHQIGKPVALHAIVNLLDKESGMPEREVLLLLIEQYQKMIGVNLAKSWNFPDSIILTINYIDDFDAAKSSQLEVAAVNAGRLLADISLGESEGINFVDVVEDQAVFNALNLNKEDIQLLDDKRESVSQLLQSLVV